MEKLLARSKILYIVFSLMAAAFVLTGCGTSKEEKTAEEKVDYASAVKENPIVTITMNDDKKIVVELEPKVAPNTVANFISLVNEGFYDGLIFHRVIPGFMIQGAILQEMDQVVPIIRLKVSLLRMALKII